MGAQLSAALILTRGEEEDHHGRSSGQREVGGEEVEKVGSKDILIILSQLRDNRFH